MCSMGNNTQAQVHCSHTIQVVAGMHLPHYSHKGTLCRTRLIIVYRKSMYKYAKVTSVPQANILKAKIVTLAAAK